MTQSITISVKFQPIGFWFWTSFPSSLPDRYEPLAEKVGSDVAKILVPPNQEVLSSFQELALGVKTRNEGAFVPLSGPTGAGKTTFVSSLDQWMAATYAPTLTYDDKIDFDGLKRALEVHRQGLPADDNRIIPINIDHRESNPPSSIERAAIKRFLRTSGAVSPCVVFWPETSEETAKEIADSYVEISGEQPIQIPFLWRGPERQVWSSIVRDTMRIANNIDDLEGLGVDPNDYNVDRYRTIGEFIRKISLDFNANIQKIRALVEKPINLAIVFVSESSDPGVLSHLLNNSRYGLCDGSSLVGATPESQIGKWWASRRGLLTRMIVHLGVHALFLPPTTAISIIRNANSNAPKLLDDAGVRRYGPGRAIRDLKRTTLGKYILGQELGRVEGRGAPSPEAARNFALIAKDGFVGGKDKIYNKSVSDAIEGVLREEGVEFEKVQCEKKLAFAPLKPDTSIHYENKIVCIEYTWRSGEFLKSKRSVVAQYILEKLKNYAIELSWAGN